MNGPFYPCLYSNQISQLACSKQTLTWVCAVPLDGGGVAAGRAQAERGAMQGLGWYHEEGNTMAEDRVGRKTMAKDHCSIWHKIVLW